MLIPGNPRSPAGRERLSGQATHPARPGNGRRGGAPQQLGHHIVLLPEALEGFGHNSVWQETLIGERTRPGKRQGAVVLKYLRQTEEG